MPWQRALMKSPGAQAQPSVNIAKDHHPSLLPLIVDTIQILSKALNMRASEFHY